MDASLIIVSWNAKDHLINCLNSILKFRKNGWEIIVVDNGSTDGGPDVVENQFPMVQMIKNNENLGFARANNIGIRVSTGRYVCFINSDVIVQDGCIEKLMEVMDQNPSVGMCGPKILNPDGTLQPSCQNFPGVWNNFCHAIGLNCIFPHSAFFSEPYMKYWPHDSVRRVDALNGCFWIVRRTALDHVGLLDENFFIYGEDVDWCKRFHDTGWDVVFFPQAQAVHFGAASSSRAPIRFYIEMQKADLFYWRKHHGRIFAFVYRLIVLLRHVVRLIARMIEYVLRPANRPEADFKLKRSLATVRWALGLGRAN